MIKSKFSEKLIELRKLHKYKQRYVAKFIGVTTRVYGYWESGRFPTGENFIIKLCELYGIGANELFSITTKYEYPNSDICGEGVCNE